MRASRGPPADLGVLRGDRGAARRGRAKGAAWQRRGGLDARTGAPRPRRSKGRPKGRTDASEPGTAPATRATFAELAGAGVCRTVRVASGPVHGAQVIQGRSDG